MKQNKTHIARIIIWSLTSLALVAIGLAEVLARADEGTPKATKVIIGVIILCLATASAVMATRARKDKKLSVVDLWVNKHQTSWKGGLEIIFGVLGLVIAFGIFITGPYVGMTGQRGTFINQGCQIYVGRVISYDCTGLVYNQAGRLQDASVTLNTGRKQLRYNQVVAIKSRDNFRTISASRVSNVLAQLGVVLTFVIGFCTLLVSGILRLRMGYSLYRQRWYKIGFEVLFVACVICFYFIV